MKYVLKKIGTLIITLLVISIVTFLAFRIIPGDQVTAMLGTEATEERAEALREEMGLNKPVAVQYFNWLMGFAKGDLGTSTAYKMDVWDMLKEKLPVTVSLAGMSFLIIVVVSIPLGVLSARREGSMLDHLVHIITQFTMAVPSFFLGIFLTLVFGLILKWFTPGKFVSLEESVPGFFAGLIFPAIAIALPKIAMVVKFLRNSILSEMSKDYVRTAYSRGNKENRVLYVHVLRNALIPVITFLGIVAAESMAALIVAEQVFNLPGVGRLLVSSIGNRDFAVVQVIVLYIAFIVVFVNFLVDLIYQLVDPRVRLD